MYVMACTVINKERDDLGNAGKVILARFPINRQCYRLDHLEHPSFVISMSNRNETIFIHRKTADKVTTTDADG